MVTIFSTHETFLGFFPLETGGKIIGWFKLFVGALVTLLGLVLFMTQVKKLFEPPFRGYGPENFNSETRRYIIAIIGFLATVIGCFTVYAAAQLIDGSNEVRA